ncbi:MAG: glycosyl hydrolase family 28-related protein [Planctomycetota bacterium]|jgi:hypothetical protein|nr:glycosyl hydrolase family 28-related protein [Planctomycetota bacterium]
MRTLLACFLLTCVAASLSAVEYRWPDDANILDVKRDFGAVGDGKADDTAAIQKAIVVAIAARRQRQMVYIPKGTYRLTRALRSRMTDAPDGEGGWSDGWRSGLFICGESREGTILKLDDNAEGFGDPAKSRALLVTGSTGHGKAHGARIGGWGNEAFQNTLMNFTVDTGSGNPGAIGVDFLASNRGTMEEITVRSGDGAGRAGVSCSRAWPGPALVKSVLVEGFDYGLTQRSMDCSMTYEHLTFRGQHKAAIRGTGSPFMSLRGIISDNAVPAFDVEGKNAVVNVLDSRFTYTGTGDAPPAMIAKCRMVLKGIASKGYAVLLADSDGKTTIKATAEPLAFYSSEAPKRQIAGPNEVPNLEVLETPTWHHNDFSKWASPKPYALGSRTAGIQEAIDSGAEIVYLPHGTYHISEEIILRGNLRKLIGCESDINTAKDMDHAMRFIGSADSSVIIEHISGGGEVIHDGAGTLTIRKCDLGYRNTIRGSGDAFLEDGMFKRSQVLFPQRFFARQYNSEYGSRAQLTVRHADAWVLGLKVEGDHQALLTIGGRTECYALYSMTGKKGSPQPYIENREGWVAVSTREGGQGTHRIRVKDTWNGETKSWTKAPREITLQLCGQAYDPAEGAPAAPKGLSAIAEAHDAVTLSWQAPESQFPIAYYVVERDGTVVGSSEADQLSYIDAEAGESVEHRYGVRAVNWRGGSSSAADTAVKTPADTRGPAFVTAAIWPADAAVVTVDFDQALNVKTVSPKAFSFEPAVPISRAELNGAGDRVVLHLGEALKDGGSYMLTATGLTDRSAAGNALAEPTIALTAWLMGDGLKAEFFNQKGTFEGEPDHVRVDTKINSWWGDKSPVEDVIRIDDFTCRWSGWLRPKVSGTYKFNTGIRTGGRIFLDGEGVHEQWSTKNEWTHSREVELEAGRRYRFVFETHHDSGGAGVRLKWIQPGSKDASFIDQRFLFTE